MSNKVSQMVTAVGGLMDYLGTASTLLQFTNKDGLFGRVVKISCNGLELDGSKLDMEFDVPFDDDTEANEAEIIVYNLSKDSISKLEYNKQLTITAGYAKDTGVIFSGYVSKVYSKRDGQDLKTTIKAIDSSDLKERKIDSIAYGKGAKASYILKDLITRAKLPLVCFKPKRDWTYKDSVTVDGDLMASIKKYAEVCGISVYILKGKAYARHIKDGDNIEFTVGVDTGMVDSPEEFEEEITAEDFKDKIKGYKVKMLLQHRVCTAAIINLESLDVNGSFRVRKGRHVCNESDFYTEMEVI